MAAPLLPDPKVLERLQHREVIEKTLEKLSGLYTSVEDWINNPQPHESEQSQGLSNLESVKNSLGDVIKDLQTQISSPTGSDDQQEELLAEGSGSLRTETADSSGGVKRHPSSPVHKAQPDRKRRHTHHSEDEPMIDAPVDAGSQTIIDDTKRTMSLIFEETQAHDSDYIKSIANMDNEVIAAKIVRLTDEVFEPAQNLSTFFPQSVDIIGELREWKQFGFYDQFFTESLHYTRNRIQAILADNVKSLAVVIDALIEQGMKNMSNSAGDGNGPGSTTVSSIQPTHNDENETNIDVDVQPDAPTEAVASSSQHVQPGTSDDIPLTSATGDRVDDQEAIGDDHESQTLSAVPAVPLMLPPPIPNTTAAQPQASPARHRGPVPTYHQDQPTATTRPATIGSVATVGALSLPTAASLSVPSTAPATAASTVPSSIPATASATVPSTATPTASSVPPTTSVTPAVTADARSRRSSTMRESSASDGPKSIPKNLVDTQEYKDWARSLSLRQIFDMIGLPPNWNHEKREELYRQFEKAAPKDHYNIVREIDKSVKGQLKTGEDPKQLKRNCLLREIANYQAAFEQPSDLRSDCPSHGDSEDPTYCLEGWFAEGIQYPFSSRRGHAPPFDANRVTNPTGIRWFFSERRPYMNSEWHNPNVTYEAMQTFFNTKYAAPSEANKGNSDGGAAIGPSPAQAGTGAVQDLYQSSTLAVSTPGLSSTSSSQSPARSGFSGGHGSLGRGGRVHELPSRWSDTSAGGSVTGGGSVGHAGGRGASGAGRDARGSRGQGSNRRGGRN